MAKRGKASRKPLLARLLEVNEKDAQHIPFLVTIYVNNDTWLGASLRYSTWAGLLHLPRIWLWWTAVINGIFVVTCVVLFLIAGTPIRGVTYTWWLIALAIFAIATFGWNTVKVVHHLIRSGKQHGK